MALSLVDDETMPELTLPDLFWARVPPMIESRREEIERDRIAAGPLYDQLISHPPEERIEIVHSEPRFLSPGLVQLLLAAAEEVSEHNLERAEDLAQLALKIAQELPMRVGGEHTLAELRTRIWCQMGDLRRMRGDFREASRAFRRAADPLAAEPLDSLGRAVLCTRLARLRKEQGRVDEALALYGRAAVLLEALEEFAELGTTLVEEAWLRYRELDPESALSVFQAALVLIDSKLRPLEALSARHGLALCCADLGRPAEAEEILAEAWQVVNRLSDPVTQLRHAWIDAQVAERSGDLGKATEVLRRVVGGLIAEGAAYDAALAALELARLYIELGSEEELERLRSEIAPLNALADRHPAAWEALSLALAHALRGDPGSDLLLENVTRYLTRVRHDPHLNFHPWFKAPTEIHWDEIDPALRRQLCEQAGLEPELTGKPAAQIDELVQDQIARAFAVLTGLRVLFPGPPKKEH